MRSSDFFSDEQLAALKETVVSSLRVGCSVAAFIAPIVGVYVVATVATLLFRKG